MTIPTGLGLTRGLESADQPGAAPHNRATWAKMNDAKAVKGVISEPCYCGSCDMTDKGLF